MRSAACVLFILVLCSLLTGCGGSDRPDLVKVSGQVTLNGKPLEGAMVGMRLVSGDNPKFGRPPQGITDASGNFTPKTYGDAVGIPLGTYQVTVIKQEVPEGYNSENPALTAGNIKWITPKVYSDVATSGLKLEVTADGMTPAILALESTGKPEVESTRAKPRANEP